MATSFEKNNFGLSVADNTPWGQNWDADNYETYNPLPPGLMTKAQKKRFKESERERMKKYVVKTQPPVTNKNTSPEQNRTAPTNTVNVPNEENWDKDNYDQKDTPHASFWEGSCEENWDNDNYPTYNPLPHVLANNIIRRPPANLPKEEKKQFKQNERARMKKFVNKTKVHGHNT